MRVYKEAYCVKFIARPATRWYRKCSRCPTVRV